MKNSCSVFAVVALIAGNVAAHAQSPLAEAARREALRRSAARAASVPTYTNDDLSRLPARPTASAPAPAATQVTTVGAVGSAASPPAGPPSAAAPSALSAAATADASTGEKYWRDRITTARTNLSRAEIFAEALQSRINALSTDAVNRDDPAQRQQLLEQRQKALDELARVQAEIAGFQKQIADIEEEARRLNVPPGWLR